MRSLYTNICEVYVEKRENAVVNRLNKTKEEKYPDLRAEREGREREDRKKERIAAQEKVRILSLSPASYGDAYVLIDCVIEERRRANSGGETKD